MGAITGISCRTSAGIFPTHFDNASTLTGLITWSVDLSTLWREKERLYFALQPILASSLALRLLACFVGVFFLLPLSKFHVSAALMEVLLCKAKMRITSTTFTCDFRFRLSHRMCRSKVFLHKNSSESQRAAK